jgi:predicted DNA-binding protein (MmcQ/YjbR family)
VVGKRPRPSAVRDLCFTETIPDEDLLDAVDDSCRLVVSQLPKKHRPSGWDDA